MAKFNTEGGGTCTASIASKVGRKVRTLNTITTGEMVIAVGTVLVIDDAGRRAHVVDALDLSTAAPCPHCGVRIRVHGVAARSVVLLAEASGAEAPRG